MMLVMRQGTFIAIEGVDKLGNASQLDLLKSKLQKSGYSVMSFDFTELEEPAGMLVTQYLEGKYGSENDVGPYTSSLFYALNRYQASNKIKTALEEGKIVLATGFTGSSMANQSSIFQNPEDRRGFFVWLDNLDYQMLRLPRPDKSFVLRMPTTALSGQFKNVSVSYDDLCQLFPNDYLRVDFVRSNKAMSPEQLHDYIWKLTEPLLPKSAPKPSKKIGKAPPSAVVIPDELSGKIRNHFTDSVGRILELRRQMSQALAKLDHITPETVEEILESMLPVAAYRSPSERLMSLDLLGVEPAPAKAIKLSETYLENEDSLKMLSVQPRNELTILPELIYTKSALPLSKLTEQVNKWSYEQKTNYLESFYNSSNTFLSGLNYKWEFVAPIYSLREIEGIGGATTHVQQFSPRYGFDVSDILDSDELLELYEGAFEESLKLHSALQAAGHHNIAQLATLRGHKARCLLSVNGSELKQLANLSTAGEYSQTRELLQKLLEKVQEVHPLAYEHYTSGSADR